MNAGRSNWLRATKHVSLLNDISVLFKSSASLMIEAGLFDPALDPIIRISHVCDSQSAIIYEPLMYDGGKDPRRGVQSTAVGDLVD